ncbi:helix-turn-helix transcriptional regulator [Micromonospora sp. M12]
MRVVSEVVSIVFGGLVPGFLFGSSPSGSNRDGARAAGVHRCPPANAGAKVMNEPGRRNGNEPPIGRRMAELRAHRGMSQQVFADRISKSKSWVDKVERGCVTSIGSR